MAYRVLARKYRPQSFSDLIGQSHIATTLANALKTGKVAHAYLFSGPRGVGKTTSARILAKALNCEKGPTAEPCNACDSCQRIAQGQEMVDVLEIDAASNRGIEEIRELRDNVRYAPAKSRYKVYIVDEAHQITHDAFNAFLKTLEEPPPHAVFILATTESQKIPPTITSRCQLFRFKRVAIEEITDRLQKIVDEEKLAVDRKALERLARAAGGSVRDALSLLDQALAYATDSLTLEQTEILLGFLPQEALEGFASAIFSGQSAKVLDSIKRLMEDGWDLPQFIRDFREYLREGMVTQISGGTRSDALTIAGQTAPLSQILRVIKLMGQCLDEMRWNDNPRIVLELYALRLSEPYVDAASLVKRLEELESRTETGTPVERGNPSAVVASATSKPLPMKSAPVSSFAAASKPANKPEIPLAKPATASSAGPETNGVTDPASLWKKLVAELWKKPMVATQLEKARVKQNASGEWILSVPDKFAMDTLSRSQALIQETLENLAGKRIGIRIVQETRVAEEGPAIVEVSSAGPAAVEVSSGPPDPAKEASVQRILDTFKGKIRMDDEA